MNKKTKWSLIALIGIGLAGMAIHAFLPRENKELSQAPQKAQASNRSRTLNVIEEIIRNQVSPMVPTSPAFCFRTKK